MTVPTSWLHVPGRLARRTPRRRGPVARTPRAGVVGRLTEAAVPPLTRAVVALLWAAALGAAGYLALMPYERQLEGQVAGSVRLVDSECPAALGAAVFGATDTALNAAGDWARGDPPCRRSARFRVGLAALVGVTGAGLATVLSRRAQARARAPVPARRSIDTAAAATRAAPTTHRGAAEEMRLPDRRGPTAS